MLTINIALISFFAGLGSCVPNDYPAESHSAAGDPHWTPPATLSTIVTRGNGAVDKTDVMAPGSSIMSALIAGGGAMSTFKALTDRAVFTFSHANTMEGAFEHGRYDASGRTAVDLYKHHGLSRLRKRWIGVSTPAKGVIAVIVMASMFAAVLLIFVCRSLCQNGDPDQVRLSPPHVRPDDDEPVTGYPVETRTGVGLHQDVQIGIPMMPSSPIRPDVSTLPSIGLERRIPANSGGNMFSSFSPSRSVAGDGSDSGRPLTDRN
ncbi:hypothetical protein SeLEV6574_g05774 [Synchytrium endobioticum]|uniref:Uncharacterized protein n=1 Tax=Synchytrium endobioticum TaxID=286115 RepID=A0A507CSJ5_9FUNG|nr:hypothetical protein SeLEV6574_g05774 [Synchytrium endobioticum]